MEELEKYNSLTILKVFKKNVKGINRTFATVKCDCGTIKECEYYSVKSGLAKSCGCLKKKSSAKTSKNRSLENKNKHVGTIYTTNEGYTVKIVDYTDRHSVTIEFQNEPFNSITTTMQNIKKGQIKNPYHRTVYGIGYYGDGKYTARIDNIKTLHYIKWFSMFNRCYDEKYHESQPRYIGCTVDESFHCFQDFAQWLDDNWYEYSEMLELDKDLLVRGNKVYSKDTCCIIPKEVNNAIVYKSSDKEYMLNIYNKYKDLLPKKALDGLKQYL